MTAFAHTTWQVMERSATRLRSLYSLLHDAFVEAREARIKLEAELYRDRYRWSSKNDDDLPLVR